MTAGTDLLEVFGRALAPRAVAVYGASGKRPEASQGARIVSRLIVTGYAGRVAVVNPTAQEVHGIPTIPSALESPLDIDLALIAVPRGSGDCRPHRRGSGGRKGRHRHQREVRRKRRARGGAPGAAAGQGA